MKATVLVTVVAAVVVSAGSAMSRGPEVRQRVGAFQKGGIGVEVRSHRSERKPEPSDRLAGNSSAGSPADRRVTETDRAEQLTTAQSGREGQGLMFR